jgi:hypothetical protein
MTSSAAHFSPLDPDPSLDLSSSPSPALAVAVSSRPLRAPDDRLVRPESVPSW